ncbi:MAG TPA: hypothetical protein VMD29_03135 [Terracidiphilus sp.]|nr:hypothetical protein [Terracidiphilus sp.]
MNATRLFSAVLLVVTACGITATAQETKKDKSPFRLCHTTYALCTFAQCGPAVAQGNRETTTCACRVWQGYSVAAVAPKGTECDGPRTTRDGKIKVISRYYPIPGYGTCSNNNPWAMCLDMPCVVDSNDKTKANCTCSVQNRQSVTRAQKKKVDESKMDYLVSYGAACPSGIISSATVFDLDNITGFLNSQDKIPVQDFIVAEPKQQ